MGGRQCGIAVFADEPVSRELPASMRWGSPCQRDPSHVHEGRTLRRKNGGTCVACDRIYQARLNGRPDPDVRPEALIARSLEAAKPKAAKPKPKSTRAPKGQGRGYGALPSPGGERCRKCGKRLNRVCVANREPYCSKACAGVPDKAGGEDVSDAELAALQS